MGSFISPFIKQENRQFKDNKLMPEHYYKPLIYLKIINPKNGREQIVSCVIDTGADHCFIGKKLADYFGLENSNERKITVWNAFGSSETLSGTECSYFLADKNKLVVDQFPKQTMQVYINEKASYYIALGWVGFLDRFKKVEFNYPNEMRLYW